MEVAIPVVGTIVGSCITAFIAWKCRKMESADTSRSLIKKKNKQIVGIIENKVTNIKDYFINILNDPVYIMEERNKSLIINFLYLAACIKIMSNEICPDITKKCLGNIIVRKQVKKSLNKIQELLDDYLDINQNILMSAGNAIISEIKDGSIEFVIGNESIDIFNDKITDFLERYQGWGSNQNFYYAVLYLLYKEFEKINAIYLKCQCILINLCTNYSNIDLVYKDQHDIMNWIYENSVEGKLIRPKEDINICKFLENVKDMTSDDTEYNDILICSNVEQAKKILWDRPILLLIAEPWCPVSLMYSKQLEEKKDLLNGPTYVLTGKPRIQVIVLSSWSYQDIINGMINKPNILYYWVNNHKEESDTKKYFVKLREKLKVSSIPMAFFVDARGNVHFDELNETNSPVVLKKMLDMIEEAPPGAAWAIGL
jgi:hypothetical protein